jgi:hypothetical protein
MATDAQRKVAVRVRQGAEVGIEIRLFELRIVAALADRFAQSRASPTLRGALVVRFIEAVLEVGEAFGPVAAVGFIDADADADPVVVERLVAARAQHGLRRRRAEFALCDELVDGRFTRCRGHGQGRGRQKCVTHTSSSCEWLLGNVGRTAQPLPTV